MALPIQSGEPVRSVDVEHAFATASTAVVVAHQGGWDEALLIAGPILLIAVLLTIAKRRVDAANRAASDEPGNGGPVDGGPVDGGPVDEQAIDRRG
jgi:hypothetical protein